MYLEIINDEIFLTLIVCNHKNNILVNKEEEIFTVNLHLMPRKRDPETINNCSH